jgi:hypothetical protein
MTPPVSVPEKTLEHWSSQYVTYRYRSNVPQWWPANGQDIDVRLLPGLPGKAVQIELKTTTPAGVGLHDVHVDLGQLWEYSQKPLGQQPFYAFPSPHWNGDLARRAKAAGLEVTELAFKRTRASSRSEPSFWFADWMVVLTTAQVAAVLSRELAAHRSRQRGTRKRLVRFNVKNGTNAVWGNPKLPACPPVTVTWLDFWDELEQCGREGWPQLIRLPAPAVDRLRQRDPEFEGEDTYFRYEVAEVLRGTADIAEYWQNGGHPYMTLTPDIRGGYRIARDHAGDLDVSNQPGTGDDTTGEPDDHRQVIFLDSRKLASMSGKASQSSHSPSPAWP